MANIIPNSFISGTTWVAYEIIEMINKTEEISPFVINLNLKIFEGDYIVTKEFFSLEEMICFSLTLEENKKSHARKGRVKTPVDIQTIQFAVSIDDAILFCSHKLSQTILSFLEIVFDAREFIKLPLSGSPPQELLLMYRQSKNFEEMEDLKTEILALDSTKFESMMEDRGARESTQNEVRVPEIRKINFVKKKIRLDFPDLDLQSWKLTDVEVELHGRSTFQLFHSLEKLDKMDSVPNWIPELRRKGVTYCEFN